MSHRPSPISCPRLAGAALCLLVWAFPAWACTSVFVGKDASATGHVLIARNEDYRAGWAKHFLVVPSRSVASGEKQSFWSGMELGYPQDMTRTYRYFSVPDWIYDPKVAPGDPSQEYTPMDEVGINEKGVAVSATETQGLSAAAKVAIPLDGLIEEAQIPSIILPRAATARQGVELFGAAIEAFGSGEAGGFAVADRDEVWYVEYQGRTWAAARVPDDRYIVVPNQKVLSNFNPYDSANFLGTASLVALARDHHLLPEEETTEAYVRAHGLNVAKAFGTQTWKTNGVRVWWGHRHFSPSQAQAPEQDFYPFFMAPDRKITKKDIMAFLKSNNYTGTPYENPKPGVTSTARPIAVRTNLESHIVELGQSPRIPGEIGNVLWLNLGNGVDGVYLPFCQGLTALPASFALGTDQPEAQSPYWSFYGSSKKAQEHDDTHGTHLEAGLRGYWDPFQDELTRSFERFQDSALRKNATGDALASYLNDQAALFSTRTIAQAQKLQGDLDAVLPAGAGAVFAPTFHTGEAPRAEDVPGYVAPDSGSSGCSVTGLAPFLLLLLIPALGLRRKR